MTRVRLLFPMLVIAASLSVAQCGKSDTPADGPKDAPDLKVHRIALGPEADKGEKALVPVGKNDGKKGPTATQEKGNPAANSGSTDDGGLTDAALSFVEGKLQKDSLQDSRTRDVCERTIRDSKQFISVIRDVYSNRDYSPVFFEVRNGVPILTDVGVGMKNLLLGIPSHGLQPKDYQLDRLGTGLEELKKAIQDYEDAMKELSGKRTQALWAFLDSFVEVPSEGQMRAKLKEKGFGSNDTALMGELERFYPNSQQARRRITEAVFAVDIAMLHGFFQFVLDFKYIVKAHPLKASGEASLAHVKLKDQLREEFRKATPKYDDYLKEMVPTNPTYEGLRKGIALYQRLSESDELEKVKISKNLAKGSKGPEVRELAVRLAAEGYLDQGAVGDRFGDALEDAVKTYQQTHQLKVTGKSDEQTRASLNVSMGKRLKQVELALQRWRESDINKQKPNFFLRVNIPQFELEVWENNKLTRKHRVVVGSTDEATNLEKRIKGQLNYTPLLTKEMKTIVLNPFWYPPPRIQKELHSDLLREPDYLERNNFGVRMLDDGTEIIYQKAGGSNALGRVKFLFPNEHDVYLHDTPQKSYFDRPIRAYSHGCMRLEKPLEMAEFLLGRQNGLDKDDIQKMLDKSDKESYVKLKEPVPIFVEYATVGVGAHGHLEFYLDVYKYDRSYWDQRLPVKNHRELTDSEARALTKDGGEDGSEEEVDDGVVPGE